jgi:diaminohydroxyphosphoribosylaminopyrimidine deaminase/5-amino-6-(5-phosphoribosylamino)uracil reductase
MSDPAASGVDARWMARALELAERGRGHVEPNPMVGCVLLAGGEVIGEGWHARFGGPHAEVQALRSAAQLPRSVRGATAYVTLEPCCHQGKTPPCTQALIRAGVARVVIAMEDPDWQVAGRGIAELVSAGLTVDVGVMAQRAQRLLAPYVKTRRRARPWVIAKWAQTPGGLWALPTEAGRWLSGPASREQVHRLRSWCDGICIGAGTALADDPLLTNRSGAGRRPVRVVLDGRLRLPAGSKLVRSIDQAPLIVATTARGLSEEPLRADALARAGAELLPLPAGPDGSAGVDIAALLDELGRRNWTYLLVEGGPTLISAWAVADLLDEAWVYIGPDRPLTSEQTAGLARLNADELADRLGWPIPETETVDVDTLRRYWLAPDEP